MGGIGFSLEIAPVAGAKAAAPPALYDEVSSAVTAAIERFGRTKGHRHVLFGYAREYGAEGNTPKRLSFAFSDGGGEGYLAMEAQYHWFRLLLAAMREPGKDGLAPLDALAERAGYRITAKREPLDRVLADEAKHRRFVELRGVLHQVQGTKAKPSIWTDERPAPSLSIDTLRSAERARVDALVAEGRCGCNICEALRAGRRPEVKLPKPAKPKPDPLGGAVSRKKLMRINGAKLRALPDEVLSARGLVELSVSNTPIAEVPEAIGELTRLESLSFMRTKIKRLPASVARLTSLRSLTVGFQPLDSVEPIGSLASLRRLYLSGSGPIVERLECARLTAVRFLTINNCDLEALPPSIGSLEALEMLEASSNRLAKLPPSLGRLKALETLSLDRNAFREVPPVVAELEALEQLDLTQCPLARLDAAHLPRNVQRLVLVDCEPLTALPDALGAFPKLSYLDLRGTPLTALADALANLPLEGLLLDGTKIAALPPWLRGAKTLKRLWVDPCPAARALPDWLGELAGTLTELRVSARDLPRGDKARLARLLPKTKIVVE